MKYFNYLGNMITNDANFTWKIKSKIAMDKQIFQKYDSFH